MDKAIIFPGIHRTELFLEGKVHGSTLARGESIKTERSSRAKWIRALADELICAGTQTCRQNHGAVYCFCGNCLVYREMIKQAELDEECVK